MEWQQPLALIIVATAAALLVWGRVRRRKFQFGRDTHCGCSAANRSSRPPVVTFRARKGEAPQVFVKLN